MLREAIFGKFGRFWTILGNLGRFWANVSILEGRGPHSLTPVWSILEDFNVDFGQMSVFFRQGDNRFRID